MTSCYDAVVIGSGPIGCVAALGLARRGARVLLLPDDGPAVPGWLAGEWLHPPAAAILRTLGVAPAEPEGAGGRGFAVLPDDGGEPLVLPYASGGRGACWEHSVLVDRLRRRCQAQDGVVLAPDAKPSDITGQSVRLEERTGAGRTVWAETIVAAGGRRTVAHGALGIDPRAATYSRMAALELSDVALPCEGHAHLLLGGPGPVLAYRLPSDAVRLCLDVPAWMPLNRNPRANLWDGYRAVLPPPLRAAFWRALHAGRIGWAQNQARPRRSFGREGLVLLGDAVGFHHPLTAVGLTLGLRDAIELGEAPSFAGFRRRRVRAGRVPEMLAVALYEVFADDSDEAIAIRRAIYATWRADPRERERTMAYLGGEELGPIRFGGSLGRAVRHAGRELVGEAVRSGRWRHVLGIARDIGSRLRWLVSGALARAEARPAHPTADQAYGAALKAAGAKAEVLEHPAAARQAARRAAHPIAPQIALQESVRALRTRQCPDGCWQGEAAASVLLAAEHVITCRLTGAAITETRRRKLGAFFAHRQLREGGWGIGGRRDPDLLVSTLGYLALRLLGVAADDPLLGPARRVLRAGPGVGALPPWGKLWLALMGLGPWPQVTRIAPERWALPRSLTILRARGRGPLDLLLPALACLHGEIFPLPDQALARALRDELGAGPTRGGRPATPVRHRELCAALCEELRDELRATGHAGWTPTSGLLAILALHRHHPADPVVGPAIEQLGGWLREDAAGVLGLAGIGSAAWDTALATEALAAASAHLDATALLERAEVFLRDLSVRLPRGGRDQAHHGPDGAGGLCSATVWHRWPACDCAAEVLCALLGSPLAQPNEEELATMAGLLLGCQRRDGGFDRHQRGGPAWIEPARLLGERGGGGTDAEVTGVALAALGRFRSRFGDAPKEGFDGAIVRASRWLRSEQRPDGGWTGPHGDRLATWRAVRGLMAAGAPPQDPAIVKACRSVKRQQSVDGGWSDPGRHDGAGAGTGGSHVLHTAWALAALLEAQDPEWDRCERAAHFLAASQRADGTWPVPEPVGPPSHVPPLEATLGHVYFPLWALGLYESRRLERLELVGPEPAPQARGADAGGPMPA
jgi:lanosterol synthase